MPELLFCLLAKVNILRRTTKPIPVVGILDAVSPCEHDYGEECDGDIGGGGSFVQANMKGNSAV